MAQSVKIDFNIWSQFDHHAYDIINEDFVHDNLFKINANILSSKAKIRLQQSLKQKKTQFTTSGQTNIWFPLIENRSLYFQLRTKGFRIHLDNGLLTRGHLQHNFYSSYQSNRYLDQSLFKIGCETIAQRWRYNLRYRFATEDKSHTLYSRWRYDYKNWTFEGIKAFNCNELILLKNNFLIGYYKGNKTYHLRFQNQGWRTQSINLKQIKLKDFFDYLKFNFTKTLNANQRFGLQTGINVEGILKPISFVWEQFDPISHSTLKLKLSTDMNSAISIRNTIGSYGSYVLGVGIHKLGTQNKVNFGVLVDLNL